MNKTGTRICGGMVLTEEDWSNGWENCPS